MKNQHKPLATVDSYQAMAICSIARTSLREFRKLRSALAGESKLPAQARLLLAFHREGLIDLAAIDPTPKGA